MSQSEKTRTREAAPIVDWALIDWRKAEQTVYRLQKRIFRASCRGKVQVVHNLQRKLMRSWSARLLAVRRVTQDNQGKKTAGVDGKTALSATERAHLVQGLNPQHRKRRKPLPVRRVWIPKPGKVEKRPLGIPTIKDRAEQAIAKQALEPEWEARFEPNSYGFRPGRSQHDAIGAIFNAIRCQAKYVLDADIAGCFDHINQQALLAKLGTYPAMRRAIRAWLKAGVMEGTEFTPTEEGTPQGGVISPLLANIALHGLEEAVQRTATAKKKQPILVRYADDFVILHREQRVIRECQELVATWLERMGLELKPSKTRIAHTLDPHEGGVGFSFLGFEVRQYPAGKHRSARSTHGKPLGFKTLIKPSQEAQSRHVERLRQSIRRLRGAPQEEVISHLNPQISGWGTYYRTVVAKDCFVKMDHLLFHLLWKWAKWRHPDKGRRWRKQHYWQVTDTRKWVFATPAGVCLASHARITIRRHRKVEGTASPYDGALVYWARRNYESPLTRTRVGYLLRLQQGKCPWCGLYFRDGDRMELDHILPKRLGGTDETSNLQVLHRHCHDQKTGSDGSSGGKAARGISESDNDLDAEEPDATKAARPVRERRRGK